MEMWSVIEEFNKMMVDSGRLEKRRKDQTLEWVNHMTEEHVHNLVFNNPNVIEALAETEKLIRADQISATMAAQNLIDKIEYELKKPVE